MNLADMTVVVTGAGGGLGRALAIALARRGAAVALADLNEAAVQASLALAQAASSSEALVTAHVLDVSDLDQWAQLRDDLKATHGVVDGLMNNAGITVVGDVQSTSYAHLERVMSVNFMGMVYGTKTLLPDLLTRPSAFIANVSSVFGLFPKRDQTAYCSSKFAIRGFTEALAQDLADSSILVSCVHPGHIGTDIIGNAMNRGDIAGAELSERQQSAVSEGFKRSGMSPEAAAGVILDGLSRKKRRILVGKDAVWGDRFSRWFPMRFTRPRAAEKQLA